MKRWSSAVLMVGCLALAGCGGSSQKSGGPQASRSTSPPRASASASSKTASSSASKSPATTTSLPAGGPVPAGFEPQSVTFVSTEVGYVLGTTRSCASAPCTSMVRTTDGGAHWVGVSAPRTTLNSDLTGESATAASVTSVRFADATDGYAFGPALWVTHDGARSWQQAAPGGSVIGLATAAGKADAVVEVGAATHVVSTPVTRQSFTAVTPSVTQVTGAGTSYDPDAAAVVLHPPAGFALLEATGTYPDANVSLYAENASGRWSAFADPCSAQQGEGYGFASFAAPDSMNLFTLCTGQGAAGSSLKDVVLTRNGRTTVLGAVPSGGDGGQIAAASVTTLVVASRSGATLLYRSTNGGRTWTTALTYGDGGVGFSDLGFTSATQGVVIYGRPTVAPTNGTVATPDEFLMTHDGGATWKQVSF